jgi:hypothetical protein
MGFDEVTSKAVLEQTNGNVESALDKLLSDQFFLSPDIRQLMEMGFGYKDSQEALQSSKGNVDRALEDLLTRATSTSIITAKPTPAPVFHKGECTFFEGLIATVRDKLKDYNHYCCICGVKHSCNRYDYL